MRILNILLIPFNGLVYFINDFLELIHIKFEIPYAHFKCKDEMQHLPEVNWEAIIPLRIEK